MTLKPGMLVRVTAWRCDDHPGMPENRCGLLLHRVSGLPHYTCVKPEPTDIWEIQMTNGTRVQFHKMHLEPVTIT